MQVDKFTLLVNFVILDMEENVEVPLILRILFMKTAKVITDVDGSKL